MYSFILSQNAMTYSTTDKIRAEAWFVWNTNIEDTYIDSYRNRAYWLCVSYISWVYNIWDLVWVNFIGSQWALTLELAETLIGAWYLLIDQYWNNDLWGWKTGWDRVNEWKSLLVGIVNWYKLIGNDWNEFTRKTPTSSWSLVASWTTSTNKFSVDDEY